MTETKRMPVLPVEAYTSQAWFDREQAQIFSRTWAFAGLAEDIGEPGQYRAVQAGLNNIFIVMGRDGHLRAFHNLCRHRGTRLVPESGQARRLIACPYHDWAYDLEGRLIAVPEKEREFPDLDLSCHGLKPASVALWRGMLWVHPSPDAGPIAEWFGAVEPQLGPHRPEELVEIEEARSHHEIKANWKIVVENYIDAYHLSHLHSGTLAMYDHAKIESGFVGPHFAFWEPLADHYEADVEVNAPMPLIERVPRDRLGVWVPMLFPSLGLAESESSWSTFHVTPLAPDLSLVETRTKVENASEQAFERQAARSAGFWQRHVRPKRSGDETDPLASGDFMAEDVYICEQQQASLTSPYFSVGATARHGEAALRRYQEVVQEWMVPD
ncbi:MAG: aromatic ring-hydroxylating dioxygenase subunit alpha [Pseudomonadota bacterium]